MKSKIENANILVTGANGGMGKETVKLLLNENPARIALACRRPEAAIATRNEMAQASANVNLEAYGGFDMTDEESIMQAVNKLPADQPFDIIFLQAGGAVFTDDYQYVEYGDKSIEKTAFQNALGGYLTLKHLNRRGLITDKARIVFAGGEGARGIPGMINKPEFTSFSELQKYLEQGSESYNPMNAIGVSKLISALYALSLAENDPQREYLWFSPGLTSGTNGLDTLGGFKKLIMKNIAFPVFTFLGFAQKPKNAARKYVDSLAGRIGKTGDIIGAPEGKTLGKLVDQKPMNTAFTNYRLRSDLFDYTRQIAGHAV